MAIGGAARVTTPFGRDTTASEVVEGLDLTGKRAIVTGASTGLGLETARALASVGVEVALAARNVEAAQQAAAAIRAETGSAGVSVLPLELTDRASVGALVEGWQGPLHILVNNAGVMAVPELERTRDGWEQHFAANHLGHMALALGLHDALASAGGARIVSVSSNGHAMTPTGLDLEDPNFERRAYNPILGYAQSKAANVLFAVEATRRWADEGIMVNAAHPGGIRTDLHRHMEARGLTDHERELLDAWPWKTVAQGAATSVLLAASPHVEGIGGRYFENCNEAVLRDMESPITDFDAVGVAPYALDPDTAARLWDVSVEMLRGAGWID